MFRKVKFIVERLFQIKKNTRNWPIFSHVDNNIFYILGYSPTNGATNQFFHIVSSYIACHRTIQVRLLLFYFILEYGILLASSLRQSDFTLYCTNIETHRSPCIVERFPFSSDILLSRNQTTFVQLGFSLKSVLLGEL